jgi:uncharacterized phage protein (TIGR01671 family)
MIHFRRMIMERKIKFRAYDNIKNKMIYDVYLKKNWICYIANYGGTRPLENVEIKVGSTDGVKRIEQFTGLKDKNKKDIYEGDVVFWKGHNLKKPRKYLVVFKNGSFSGQPHKGAYYNLGILCALSMHSEPCKILGNVYENPELLEEL